MDRGENIRKTFARRLYVALVQEGLSTFKDEDMMDKGENLKSELEKAIRQSKSSIVVISKDYAASTWCLDELVLILEQRRTNRHEVLPVFYGVDPSHVRKQSGRIAEAFAKYEEQFKTETDCRRKKKLMTKIKGWKSALTEVGYLNGLDLQNHVDGHESKFIKTIVKIISDKLIQSTVVLKIRLHCEECISNIDRILSKINRVDKFILDPGKDLVTVVGRVDVKELVRCLEEKLKRSVSVISAAKKDDKGGENKEKEGDKGGNKKGKASVGDKKDEESGGGGGKKNNKMEYYRYNRNTYTIPKYHHSEKKGKESGGGGGGGGGRKENKLESSQYNPSTNTNTRSVYHYSDQNKKDCGGRGGKKIKNLESSEYNNNTYAMLVYHESYKKEKECGGRGGKKENKLESSEYNTNTYKIPVYHQSEKKGKETRSGGGGGGGSGRKENKLEYSQYNPSINTNTKSMYHHSDTIKKECDGRGGKKIKNLESSEYNQSYPVHDYTGTSQHYSQDYSAMFSDDNPNACSMM